jgi:putative ABC transport system permease protein
MNGLFQDLRYAFRQLRKSPGFTAVAVTTLALGIGANTAVFSVIDAVMLRPLPYYQPERLIAAESVNTHAPGFGALSYPDFFDWRSRNHTLTHLVSYHDAGFTLTGLDRPVHVEGQIVSWDFLPALGVIPELGRGFASEEEKAGTRVVLISRALWASQFGSDKAILGRQLKFNGNLFTVVGVMPQSFRFPVDRTENSFWTTLAVDDDPSDPEPNTAQRGAHFLNVFGRMTPGVTVGQVDQDLKTVATNLAKEYPNTNTRHDSARAQTAIAALVGDTRTPLLIVLGAVALVLLIACGNIANLMLTRMRERQREIAMRSALGAGRNRIIRQLLVESFALSVIGGLAGCGLAFLCTPAILRLIGDSVPRAAGAGVDLRVLAFSVLLSLASGLIFGIVPAMISSRTDRVSTLKEGGRSEIAGRDWLRSSLIVAQVAVGLVLTAGAGLLITSFTNLQRANEGFNPNNLLTLSFETPDQRYKETRPQFYREYFDKLRSIQGAQSVGGVLILPVTNDDAFISFEDPEHPAPAGQRSGANFTPVSPQYFSTMQIPVLEGRDFTERDDAGASQVIIVNRAFAQRFFPGEEVLGKKIKPGAGNGKPEGPPWREIVGVVGDVRLSMTQREMQPAMYVPASQLDTWCCLYSVVRSTVDPISLEQSVRQVVASMDKDIPVTQVRTMRELMSTGLSQPRFTVVLLGSFAGLAITLTIVGLYGVMTYSVTRRTREIGVRMALGAQRVLVLTMVLRDAAVLLALGIVVGIVAVLASASVLQSMLYGTGSRDPIVLTLVCTGVAFAGLVAAYIPAFRAAKVDPMVALRYE